MLSYGCFAADGHGAKMLLNVRFGVASPRGWPDRPAPLRPVRGRPCLASPGRPCLASPCLASPAFGYVAAVVRVRSCPHPSRCCAARPREAPRSDWQTRGELGCAASWAAPCPPGCARADCAPHRRMPVAGAPPGQRWSRHRNVSVVVNTVFYHCRTSSRRPWTSVPNNGGNGLQCGTPGISHKRDDVARRARGGGGGATSRALVCVRA